MRPSVVICPRVPKIDVRRSSNRVNAESVNAAVTPLAYSRLTTWWSTTSLSLANTQRP